jgi:hypothetical protein
MNRYVFGLWLERLGSPRAQHLARAFVLSYPMAEGRRAREAKSKQARGGAKQPILKKTNPPLDNDINPIMSAQLIL